ncbi:MAG: hypothetical protein H5T69_03865 [Chloroflexi bacterium]|nr:hypothetical protein [Chloroflexota bacterium]
MTWKRGTLADLMADWVVYRNMEPMDPRVAGLRASWAEMGLDHYYVPRKTTPEYAAVLYHILRQVQWARGVASPLERLLFIGDTLMNDGTAARNMARYLPLMGFIGADRLAEEPKYTFDGELMIANRWEHLDDYVRWVRCADFPCDERTALLIDLDKTSLGARGRNDKVIDAARVAAVRQTMQDALGDGFDEAAFRAVYDPLNQPVYHHFTADNQDYLAYISLMALGGVCPPEELWALLREGRLTRVEDLVIWCEARRERMSPGLRAAHDEVRKGIEMEDPTPFKKFRRDEYFQTVARMDVLPDDAQEEQVLSNEIVITAEVASVARYMGERGVLIFGISDKPDEASIPLPQDAAKGYRAIHCTPMKIYGHEIL